jgi:hypothetical protein
VKTPPLWEVARQCFEVSSLAGFETAGRVSVCEGGGGEAGGVRRDCKNR